jgi:serralysin
MPMAYRTERQTFDVTEWAYDRDGVSARLDNGPLQAVIAVNEPTDVIPADASTPYLIPVGDTATGVINTAGDVDWFRVSLQAGVTYSFRVLGDSLADPYLTIYRADSSFMAGQDNARASLDPLLTITPTQDAVYYLAARAANNTQTGTYTVTVDYATPVDAVTWNYHSPTNIDVYFATSGQFFNGEPPCAAGRKPRSMRQWPRLRRSRQSHR